MMVWESFFLFSFFLEIKEEKTKTMKKRNNNQKNSLNNWEGANDNGMKSKK